MLYVFIVTVDLDVTLRAILVLDLQNVEADGLLAAGKGVREVRASLEVALK